MVNGDDIRIIGKGDLHDPLYYSMIYTIDGSVEGTEHGKLGVVENLITYQLEIYPSLSFETQYVANAPSIYTTILAMLFLATSGIFLLYDLAVKYKHNVIVHTAVHSARILDSFFPTAFRDRLFQAEEKFPTEIVSIHEKTNRTRRSSSETSIEFVNSIVPVNCSRAY